MTTSRSTAASSAGFWRVVLALASPINHRTSALCDLLLQWQEEVATPTALLTYVSCAVADMVVTYGHGSSGRAWGFGACMGVRACMG